MDQVSHVVLQDAFWCLVQICEQYLPKYYDLGLVSPTTNTQCSGVCSIWPCTVTLSMLLPGYMLAYVWSADWSMCGFSGHIWSGRQGAAVLHHLSACLLCPCPSPPNPTAWCAGGRAGT